MSIEPDTKDWTWVLREPCPECGLSSAGVEPRAVAGLVRGSLPVWTVVLQRPGVAERPDPSTWSPLEYACHVRDVFSLFAERLELMLSADEARFESWDQDLTAVEQRYAEQDPAAVSAALVAAGAGLADAFEAVPDDAWGRTGLRSDGSTFTVETFAQYFWHDVAHHLHDVGA
ncbi:methyltransferase type 12 [Aeromicrobium sp. Root495]|uniref:DinB family protein n=1 Tax=Aeromicrobium sp. Root495 TaxID=1736550 RepID=UPI0006FEE3E1|nr:DinB family protein [Aeromicrobium sp. Root495]KQY60179.1 methyltransferase type 12 [Aeromicrobium sp. Root495]